MSCTEGIEREDAHSVISIGNTPGYEPECMVEGEGCQGRACGICWDCVLIMCFACGVAHCDEPRRMEK